MDQLLDIGLPTAIACLGVFFIVYVVDYVTDKVWTNVSKPWVRLVIKWTWTMWLPLWPIAIGAAGGMVKGVPLPEAVAALGPAPGLVSVIYGAFCGMISMGVVKAIKHALEKKGIDVKVPDLGEAKLRAKQEKVDKAAEKIKSAHGGRMPSDPPPKDESEKDGEEEEKDGEEKDESAKD